MPKTEMVVKSNRLIEASYRLSLVEQRIILYAIVCAREDKTGFSSHTPVVIDALDFAKRFPSIDKTNVYHQLKEALDLLFGRKVRYSEIDLDTGQLEKVEERWISRRSYIDGAGRIKLVFTEVLVNFITRLEQEFTSYQLEKVGNMTSMYAIRIYEMLFQYKGVGKRTLNLAWLRETLQIEAHEYKLTTDFIRGVIDLSVKQIKKHSDLDVSYETVKTGRAITDFAFKIKEKKPTDKVLTPKKAKVPRRSKANQDATASREQF